MIPSAAAAGELARASDAELATRVAAAGDEARAAEEEICRRFAPRIRLYGLKHLRSEERARDLVQSVLLALLEALRGGRVDEPARLDRFMLGCCRNLALRMQHADARAEASEMEALDVAAWLPSDDIDAEALLRCMAGLDTRAHAVVHLSFYCDKSAQEIATLLDTSAGNVRVMRHRAMAQLRHCLEVPA
jgi:RNA polymerase sigma-70 factor (ECF subfamily)